MNVEGVELARKELAGATRALDGTGASMRVPRIALVACDDSEDPMRAARHLVEDVGVPAILGFSSGQEVVDVAGSLLVRRGVLSVASLTSSPLVTRLPQPPGTPPMVWRTTYGLDQVATVVAAVVHDVLEPRLAARPGSMRVALVRDDTASALSFGDALFKQLVFNGKPAVQNGRAYQELTFAAESGGPGAAALADRVARAASTVVVLLGNGEATVPLVEAVEARWPAAAPRPTYVVALDPVGPFAGYLGDSADRRRRLFALSSVSTTETNARFVMRFNDARAGEEPVGLTLNPATSYDAFYLLAYAAYALQGAAVTGPALAGAFGRLVPPGEPIEVGPTHVFDALRLLAAGRTIDLQGAASGLDFDRATGEAPSDFALLCPAVDGAGRATGADVESGVVFRARSRRVEGRMDCP
jgi:branched-chain amino acid transport system substrate-binding protein